MRLVDERRPSFGEHNFFFLALLGLERLGRQLDDVLRAHGRARVPIDLAPDEIRDDAFLCALLGLVAFRRELGTLLSAARAAPADDAPAAGGPLGRRSILR
jgi:hypothetical protein